MSKVDIAIRGIDPAFIQMLNEIYQATQRGLISFDPGSGAIMRSGMQMPGMPQVAVQELPPFGAWVMSLLARKISGDHAVAKQALIDSEKQTLLSGLTEIINSGSVSIEVLPSGAGMAVADGGVTQ